MILNKLQKNKCFILKIKNNRSGFTILEALVAITILLISVGGMLTITATTTKAARYGKNEITANYLLQEAIDSIRNSRDTIAFQGSDWSKFMTRYGYPSSKCFDLSKGCDFDMSIFSAADSSGIDIIDCPGKICPLNYHPAGGAALYYSHADLVPQNGDTTSIFTRNITMSQDDVKYPDEVDIVATVTWKNDASTIPNTRTLKTSLLNWQK